MEMKNALQPCHQEMKINTDYLHRIFHFTHEPEILGGYIKFKMKLCFLYLRPGYVDLAELELSV